MENKISYLNKDFSDFKSAIINFANQQYPTLNGAFNDASVGSFLIDVLAGIADSLGYHIDRTYQETNIDSAQENSSIYSIAKNNGVKVVGPKGAVTEVEISCWLPNDSITTDTSEPNWKYAPIIKSGTKFSNGEEVFELEEDVDFSVIADRNGVPDRTHEKTDDGTGYTVKKYVTVNAGETKIYTKTFSSSETIKPFYEILLPYTNVLKVESIIAKKGTSWSVDPIDSEFAILDEYVNAPIVEYDETTAQYTTKYYDLYRFFEVDSLAQQYRWGEVTDSDGKAVVERYGYLVGNDVMYSNFITKGEWKPLKQKFITEYTDKGYLNITFGAGYDDGTESVDITDATTLSQYLISKIINNDALGVTPLQGTTMYIKYRVGGGKSTNIPAHSLTQIKTLKIDYSDCTIATDNATVANKIKKSITVDNTVPGVSGRDMMTTEELKYFIKYSKSAQNRCVTLKDYHAKLLQMPTEYGCPYRVGVTEENNKIMIYLLGIDKDSRLTSVLPDLLVTNIKNYLSEYKMINDYIEIKSGRIINISIEADLYIDKNYSKASVTSTVLNTIKSYMDINKHQMGDNVYIGDLQKEISKIDGVINIIEMRIYNECNEEDGYSPTQTTQAVYSKEECSTYYSEELADNRYHIDLKTADYILYSENDTMFEVKYPEQDIRVRIKQQV